MARILIFIDNFEKGGAARVVSNILPGLVKEGHDVVLSTDNVKYAISYPCPDRVSIRSFHAVRRRIPILGGIIKQYNLINEARLIIKDVKPDCIIAVTYLVYSQIYYANKGSGIPLIAYDHTSFNRNLGLLGNYIRYKLYGRCDRLIVLTEKDAVTAREKHGFSNVSVIYNPLSFKPIDIPVTRKKAVLCVGRINSWNVKGFDRIIKIWNNLSESFREWELHIAGPGDKQAIEYLTGLAQTPGARHTIRFIGNISDMQSLYRQYEIFALPSRIEGFPMALQEALSQGCACISFSMYGAVEEMMRDGISGIIIADNDLDTFETNLRKLLCDASLRERLSANGTTESQRFTLSKHMESWNKILRSLEIL